MVVSARLSPIWSFAGCSHQTCKGPNMDLRWTPDGLVALWGVIWASSAPCMSLRRASHVDLGTQVPNYTHLKPMWTPRCTSRPSGHRGKNWKTLSLWCVRRVLRVQKPCGAMVGARWCRKPVGLPPPGEHTRAAGQALHRPSVFGDDMMSMLRHKSRSRCRPLGGVGRHLEVLGGRMEAS